MKKFLSCLVSGFLFVTSIPLTPAIISYGADNYFDGSGTADSPYIIKSEQDIRQLSNLINEGSNDYAKANYIQISDIEISQEFIPIGANGSTPFTGTYNGNYCSVSGLNINSDFQFVGFFGAVNGGTVSNLSVYGDISSIDNNNSSTGGILGELSNGGTIINCSFSGTVSSTANNVGGIVGQVVKNANIKSCYVNADISGKENVGGLLGYITDDESKSDVLLSNSYMVGNVASTSNSNTVGGIAGCLHLLNSESSLYANSNFYLNSACSEGAIQSTSYTGCTKAGEAALKAWYDELGSPYIANSEQNGFNNGYPIFEWQSTPYSFVGNGTADEPYQISSKKELEIMRDLINSQYSCGKYNNAYYKQTADIDLEGENWIPIGKRIINGEEKNVSFFGNYNGQGHKITNLYIDRADKYTGLFGSFNGDKFIENLIVFGTVNSSSSSVGGICGEICNGGGTIRNCAFIGDVKGSSGSIGGIVGFAWQNANIENCYHNGNITNTGSSSAGGIVGHCSLGYDLESNVVIDSCYHVGKITGYSAESGGILGYCEKFGNTTSNISINNCYYLKDSVKSGVNGDITSYDITKLSSNLLKNVAADLGTVYVTNKYSDLNDGYPIFFFQTSEGLLGDANSDGSFNVADVVMLQKWLLCAGELTCWGNVDFCQDNKIDVFDLVLMKRYLINLGGTSSGLPSSIKLNATNKTLTVGQTAQLTATVLPETASNNNVTWSSDNTSVATVDKNGLVKAISPGNTTITAKTSSGNKQASCLITVATPTIKLDSTSKSLYIGDSSTLIATVNPSGTSVVWSTSDSKVVTVDGGKIKAVSSGDATITAKINVGGKDYPASCKVTVNKPSITLNKSSISMYVGDTSTISATVVPAGVSVSWTSSNSNVASVSSSGSVSAVSNGSATITASFTYNGTTYSATCSVSVKKPTISLSSSSGTMYPGDSRTIYASVDPSGSYVSWSSSNTGVATVSGGTITAKSAGSATITASFTYGGKTYSATYSVTVYAISLTLSSYSGSINTDVYNFSFYDGGVGYGVSLPSTSYSPSGGSVSWSVVSGNGYISGSKMIMRQPGTCTARCTFTYNGYSVSQDYTYSLSTYKTTTANNNIRSTPNGTQIGKVPGGVTVSLSELSMLGTVSGSGSLWGKVYYNGISGWIIVSQW